MAQISPQSFQFFFAMGRVFGVNQPFLMKLRHDLRRLLQAAIEQEEAFV
jgi:hypothetical protein